MLNTALAPAGLATTEVTSEYRQHLLSWVGTAVHSDRSLASDLQLCPPIQ